MPDPDLVTLGRCIAELRIARQVKQTELAYEAGVSHRTLQRLEAGDPVKSDSLMKVINCLGCKEPVLAALAAPGFSPYERLAEAGLKVTELKKQRVSRVSGKGRSATGGASVPKRRVRRARSAPEPLENRRSKAVTVQWPEDQK